MLCSLSIVELGHLALSNFPQGEQYGAVTIIYELGDNKFVTKFESHFGDTVPDILILNMYS